MFSYIYMHLIPKILAEQRLTQEYQTACKVINKKKNKTYVKTLKTSRSNKNKNATSNIKMQLNKFYSRLLSGHRRA